MSLRKEIALSPGAALAALVAGGLEADLDLICTPFRLTAPMQRILQAAGERMNAMIHGFKGGILTGLSLPAMEAARVRIRDWLRTRRGLRPGARLRLPADCEASRKQASVAAELVRSLLFGLARNGPARSAPPAPPAGLDLSDCLIGRTAVPGMILPPDIVAGLETAPAANREAGGSKAGGREWISRLIRSRWGRRRTGTCAP